MAIDCAAFRELLERRLAEIAEEDRLSAGDRGPVALDQESVGRLSRIDAMQMQAMALAQQRRRATERIAIHSALERIEGGEFGFCLSCGDAIAEARLRLNPTVVKCLGCASSPD
ncbi:TraR/DksA C4-type zinc finger protein [Altererythrobacter lauratis]|uniref:TraR/DksA family transcriptional regulator n=1 Tax=Alteraurantiacibacter lauratis TaxID=2054627 RepID=A0ABV7EGU6_9SPHN